MSHATRRANAMDVSVRHNSRTDPHRIDALRKALESGLLVRYTEALRAAAERGLVAPPQCSPRDVDVPIIDPQPGHTYNGARTVAWLRTRRR